MSVSTVLKVAVFAALPRLMTTDTAHLLGKGNQGRAVLSFHLAWLRSCANEALRLRREEIVRGRRALLLAARPRSTFVALSGGTRVAAPKPNFSSSIWLIVAGLVVISALGLFQRRRQRWHRRDPVQPVPAVPRRQQGEAGHRRGQRHPRHADRGAARRAQQLHARCRCHPTSPANLPSTMSNSLAVRPMAARLAHCCRGCCRRCCSSASGCLPRG